MKTSRQFIISLICASMAISAVAAEKKAAPKAAAPAASQPAPGSKPGLASSISGQQYGMAGCGLGSILFADQKGMIQVLAATTNGWAGTQTFGITSGTSNCVDTSAGERSASLFIVANRDSLEKDIARGNGETVSNLAQLMGCSNSELFGSKLQQNYGRIFPTQNTDTGAVVDSILNTVKTTGELSSSCKIVG